MAALRPAPRCVGNSALGVAHRRHFDIPTVPVTGDEAACREACEILGDEIVTVAVKEGYGRQCPKVLPPSRAHALIRDGARDAMSRVARCRPLTLERPIRGRFEALAEPMPREASPDQIAAAPHRSVGKSFERQ